MSFKPEVGHMISKVRVASNNVKVYILKVGVATNNVKVYNLIPSIPELAGHAG